MKQVLIRKGKPVVDEVPRPALERGRVLVRVAYSMISPGTESLIIEEGGKNLAARAVERPDLVRQTLNSIRTQGIGHTVSKITGKLSAGVAVGYSCAGTVVEVGEDVHDLRVGDRVGCAGGGLATHSEFVSVPRNLVVRVPQGCELRDAASVTLGAIALQGIRRADPRLGEVTAVIGLGLLGQLTVQMLKASGCRVVGVDVDEARLETARQAGADLVLHAKSDAVEQEVLNFTSHRGADSVLITASAESDDIVQQAMVISRRKGRVVVVGAVGLGLKRSPFYEKELDFLISCSYGPGRYDTGYELGGQDYPYAYVRWTENRNMEEYLRLVAEKRVDIASLVAREYAIDEAPTAYEELKSGARPLGVLLRYASDAPSHTVTFATRPAVGGTLNVALVGAGAFARSMHLPNLKGLRGTHLRAVVSGTGANAASAARQFGADYCTTDLQQVLDDRDVHAVLLSTRHDVHAEQVLAALRAGKAVFCEKPLATTIEQLEEIERYVNEHAANLPVLTVGFNRRFAPATIRAAAILAGRRNPVTMSYVVNAGYVPNDSWLQTAEGGGRLIGEACHMLDFFESVAGSAAEAAAIEGIAPTESLRGDDNFACSLRYADGSVAQLLYTSLGSRDFPKERVEIFGGGKVVVIDDFRELRVFGSRTKGWTSAVADKGHRELLERFVRAARGEQPAPIPMDSLLRTSRLAIELARSAAGTPR